MLPVRANADPADVELGNNHIAVVARRILPPRDGSFRDVLILSARFFFRRIFEF